MGDEGAKIDGVKRASKLSITDSGSTRDAVRSKLGMTIYRVLPYHHLYTASGEDLKVEGIGDLV